MAEEHVRVIFKDLALSRVSAQGLERWINPTVTAGLNHVIQIRDSYEALFADCIEEGVKLGEFREMDSHLMVKPFLGSLSWTVFWYRPRTTKLYAKSDHLAVEFAR